MVGGRSELFTVTRNLFLRMVMMTLIFSFVNCKRRGAQRNHACTYKSKFYNYLIIALALEYAIPAPCNFTFRNVVSAGVLLSEKMSSSEGLGLDEKQALIKKGVLLKRGSHKHDQYIQRY